MQRYEKNAASLMTRKQAFSKHVHQKAIQNHKNDRCEAMRAAFSGAGSKGLRQGAKRSPVTRLFLAWRNTERELRKRGAKEVRCLRRQALHGGENGDFWKPYAASRLPAADPRMSPSFLARTVRVGRRARWGHRRQGGAAVSTRGREPACALGGALSRAAGRRRPA